MAILAARDLSRREDHPWFGHLLPDVGHVFDVAPEHMAVLAQRGFGLTLRRERTELSSLSDHAQVARLVTGRYHHHRLSRAGEHQDAQLIADLKVAVASNRRIETRRPNIWQNPPYVLSFFYIACAAAEALDCDEARRGLSALLEPSQVRRLDLVEDDSEIDACAQLVADLNIDHLHEQYRDHDVKAGVTALCSWAGMVVFDAHGSDLPYFESLELRLQMAWLQASLARSWAEQALVAQADQPEKLGHFATEVTPILRQTRRLIDATASTRDQRLFDALVASSELQREIEGAEEAVGDVMAKLELAKAAVRRRYDQTVEGLLLLLAVLQIVPLIMDVPVTRISTLWLIPLAFGVVLLAVIRARKS